jgi:hypothetical protein
MPSRHLQNKDKTSFCLDPSKIWVLGWRRTVFHQANNRSGKENINVLLAGKAAAKK